MNDLEEAERVIENFSMMYSNEVLKNMNKGCSYIDINKVFVSTVRDASLEILKAYKEDNKLNMEPDNEIFDEDDEVKIYHSIRSANEGYNKPDKRKRKINIKKYYKINIKEYYKLTTLFSLALMIFMTIIFLFNIKYTTDKLSNLEIKMKNLEEYVSSTYNMNSKETSIIEESSDETTNVDNETENTISNISESTSNVSASIEASDEEKSVEDEETEEKDLSKYNITTVSTKLAEEKTIEGYFNSVYTSSNIDGSVNYLLEITTVNGDSYVLDNHNIKTTDSKPYRQYQLISGIDERLVGTEYKCSITLDKYKEEKIDSNTNEVIESYEVYYITTYKGLGK